ncbi:MAG: rhomboid family intramembrane serine protease [Micromonosporaceae bacterium]
MVIPVHDVNPTRRTPWVTYALIAANVIVFLLTPAARTTGVNEITATQACQQEAFYYHYAAIPRELVHNEPLAAVPTGVAVRTPQGAGCVLGPRDYDKVPALSVLFSMFLHGGWLHLLGNMLFLWVFGNNVEDRMGRLGYTAFYLFCGYAAAYGFALVNAAGTVPVVGASGAVAGVLGAYLALWPRVRVWSLVPVLFFLPLRLPVWLVLGMWFVMQWLYSVGIAVSEAGAVAYLAHVVGFLVGLLVALPLRRGRQPRYAAWPTP